ncbi:hypothetical protein MHPYR_350066 [uncultured Mycobacterium sp.]|uniref:Uncharacterized protein n=1 Tax=uncultured Mycobacterium sp. TaxID=171292 RepID=A0A1Y5PDD1_9MYCO|nr:hypothetical protein MHPYR_350066 [uncultured Mycobacterium sp.]
MARLTPSVEAMVVADSPLACIRCASAVFEVSSALGRPMDCPRARRASRAAERRSRPSSNSSSAKLAKTPSALGHYGDDNFTETSGVSIVSVKLGTFAADR